MLKTALKILLLTLLSFSCARVEIPDVQLCGDMGSEGAHCDNTITDNPINYTPHEWDEKRFGMLCMSAQDFAAIKATIDKLCLTTWRCSKEDQKLIDRFFFIFNHHDR